MEAKIATLELRVDRLEERSDLHEAEDKRLHKYMTNMMEDLQARLAGIERTGARFEADLANRNGQDATTKQRLDRISDRLAKLEKMAWMAIGGLFAVGSIATFFGWNILKLLGQ